MKLPKPWSGRFKEAANPLTEAFTLSVHYDHRLALVDLQASMAHVLALQRAKVLSRAESTGILRGLNLLVRDVKTKKLLWNPFLEDVHMNLEAALVKKIGRLGKKVHTGRSRNDQVVTDLRLYLKDALAQLRRGVVNVQAALLYLAQNYLNAPMPGYTHLQPAQPVLLAHHLLAYMEMLERDKQRIGRAYAAADVLVLGSAALAGTAYPVDRSYLGKLLGFSRISQNSMDAVSDRDFVADALYACAMIGIHLSRLGEEIILWNTTEFGFVTIGDAFTTGSSIMPQKKNPDVAELLRGKSGRVIGNLVSLLTVVKGLPLTYNRDLQEDKEPLFDSLDTVLLSLNVLAAMLPTLRFNEARMRATANAGFAAATDLADALVQKGLAFRDAHKIAARVVVFCERRQKTFADLSAAEWKKALGAEAKRLSPRACAQVIQLNAVLKARNVVGGTAPRQIKKQLAAWKRRLQLA